MGLDGVEFVMAVEEAFQIAIPDEDAQRMLTPGEPPSNRTPAGTTFFQHVSDVTTGISFIRRLGHHTGLGSLYSVEFLPL